MDGKRWIITLSKDDNVKTFMKKKLIKEKILENEKKEIYKEVLKIFPDAELIDVEEENE